MDGWQGPPVGAQHTPTKEDGPMLNKFCAAAVALGVVAVGTALAAGHLGYPSIPGAPPSYAERALARYQITCDVIDGRLSLLEAADSFFCLNRQAPVPAGVLPGDTEGERACRQVLAFVRAELEGRGAAEDAEEVSVADGAVGHAVLARLEAELEAARGADGKVGLPGRAD
jgi:hypothetical protein